MEWTKIEFHNPLRDMSYDEWIKQFEGDWLDGEPIEEFEREMIGVTTQNSRAGALHDAQVQFKSIQPCTICLFKLGLFPNLKIN